MRNTFINTLCALAEEDERIYLLTGDLGFSVLERFRDRFPYRFINAGVAEANMTGVAAGLALSGKTVFTYSITPFSVFRPFEQLRLDVCYQNLNVKVVGAGAGFDYGAAGTTHHAIEDVAVMRALPNMKILSPADVHELAECVQIMVENPGPYYLRLHKGKGTTVHREAELSVSNGNPIEVREGSDVAILATGMMVPRCLEMLESLGKGYGFSLYSAPWLKPLDRDSVLEIARLHNGLVTVEEHNVIGGLGSAVAEILAENRVDVMFKRLGIPDRFPDEVGGADYLLSKAGLSNDKILMEIMRLGES